MPGSPACVTIPFALPRAVIGAAAARNASGSEWRMIVIAALRGRTDPQGQNVMSTVASGSAALMSLPSNPGA